MPREFDEWSDEELEKHIRERVSAPMVEYVIRLWQRNVIEIGQSSAVFNFTFGKSEGKREIVETLQRLLSEATDPEYRNVL